MILLVLRARNNPPMYSILQISIENCMRTHGMGQPGCSGDFY